MDSVDDTLAKLRARGGEIATAPYPDGELTVTCFRGPAGNVLGVWQRAAQA